MQSSSMTQKSIRITKVSKHGSKHLAALTGLQTLTIAGGNEIGTEGCKHLAALTGLQSLTRPGSGVSP